MTWDVRGKVAVVTGANSGIGKEIAAGLGAAGARVVMAVRDADKGRAATKELRARTPEAVFEVMTIDLADFATVRAFAKEFLDRFDSLHVLVNNAGGIFAPRRETADGHEWTFQVNHLGPFLLTNLLLDRLKASAPARIVTTSSGAHLGSRGLDVEDLDGRGRRYRGVKAYGDSKLANIYFTQELARRFEGTGVTATCFHPGTVRTGFSGGGDFRLLRVGWQIGSIAYRSSRKGAETGLYLATAPEADGLSGGYFFDKKPGKLSGPAGDVDAARRLWEVSTEMVGVQEARA